MFSPAELIEALRRRRRLSIRPPPQADGLPPPWKTWLQATAATLPLAAASASDVVAVMAARRPIPRPPAEELHGWRALRALWRQQWDPPSQDERGLRVFSRAVSILLHLLFLVIMSWLMHARFMLDAPADAQRGEHVIEVEFIGSGTPEEEGGGAPAEPEVVATETPTPPEAAAPEPQSEPRDVEPQPSPVAAAPTEPEPEPMAASEPEPEPRPPQESPVTEQPLEVTETPAPDGPFLVPPIQPIDVPAPPAREVEVAPRERSIELAETVDVMAPPITPPEVPLRDRAQPEVEVREREIAMRPEALPLTAPEVQGPRLRVPDLDPEAREARIRDVPMPPSPDPEAATGSPTGAVAAQDSPPLANAGPPAEPDAADRAAGTGPAQAAAEGAWTAPQRGDDTGASTRDVRGGQAGTSSLFNPDGSVRLPPGQGQVGGGLPPGTITEDYEKIDRMGTWLRRPPTDYEPTRFDRFWVPHENLLEEWVRRSIRTVLIPIPGTNKTIRCNVATLALAGGCDLVDPNLQDQPAGARPPPDVPFRPDLHEDQDGLSDDVWN